MLGTRQTSGKRCEFGGLRISLQKVFGIPIASIGLVYLPTFANKNQPKM